VQAWVARGRQALALARFVGGMAWALGCAYVWHWYTQLCPRPVSDKSKIGTGERKMMRRPPPMVTDD
jgi:hypothetical protein